MSFSRTCVKVPSFDALAEPPNIPGYVKAHDQVLEHCFDHYVGGHLDRNTIRQDVINQKDYVTKVCYDCAKAIRLSAVAPSPSDSFSVQSSLASVEAAGPGNSWALFEVHLHNIVTPWCTNEMDAQWLGRLAAVDVYTSECCDQGRVFEKR